ncbi:MAG TPA: hypothetical protein VGQ11_05290, partial [Candidatus Acidoferrales bacterium]|nr:hypothetical protein [Candidatus Acidoferrales bacterium]
MICKSALIAVAAMISLTPCAAQVGLPQPPKKSAPVAPAPQRPRAAQPPAFNLPDIADISIPQFTLPALPEIPALPALQSLPTLPELPALPALTGLS